LKEFLNTINKEKEWRSRVLLPYNEMITNIINYDIVNNNITKKRKEIEEDVKCITGCKRKAKSACFHKVIILILISILILRLIIILIDVFSMLSSSY